MSVGQMKDKGDKGEMEEKSIISARRVLLQFITKVSLDFNKHLTYV